MTGKSARVVMPMITVDSVDDVHEFYTGSLGFTRAMGVAGEDGRLNMATLVLDGARIMFSRAQANGNGAPRAPDKRPVEIYLEVADVEAYHAQLKERGVEICDPLTLQWWGDKTFKVRDPHDTLIWFHQKVGAPKPPQGIRLV